MNTKQKIKNMNLNFNKRINSKVYLTIISTHKT